MAFKSSATKLASKPAGVVKTQVKEEATKNKDAPKKTQVKEEATKNKDAPKKEQKCKPTAKEGSKAAREQAKKEAQDKKREEVKRNLFDKVKNDGNKLVKAGNYQKAIECYDKCINFCPNEVSIYTNKALCYLKLKRYPKVLENCTDALKVDPTNVKALYRRGSAHKMMGSFGESRKDLEAAMVLDPTNKQALSLLSEVKKLINSAEVKKLEAGMKKVKIEEIDESSSEDEAPVQIKKSPRSRQDVTRVKSRKASCSKNSPKTQPASAENSPKPIKP